MNPNLQRPNRSCQDTPIAMPRRRPSMASPPSLIRSLSKTLLFSPSFKLSSLSDLYSSASSIRCLDGCNDDTSKCSDSLQLTGSDRFSLSLDVEEYNMDAVDASKAVSFASTLVSATTVVVGRHDYTPDEIKACWYSREEINCFRQKSKRKSFRIRRGRQWRLFQKVDNRWDAWNILPNETSSGIGQFGLEEQHSTARASPPSTTSLWKFWIQSAMCERFLKHWISCFILYASKQLLMFSATRHLPSTRPSVGLLAFHRIWSPETSFWRSSITMAS